MVDRARRTRHAAAIGRLILGVVIALALFQFAAAQPAGAAPGNGNGGGSQDDGGRGRSNDSENRGPGNGDTRGPSPENPGVKPTAPVVVAPTAPPIAIPSPVVTPTPLPVTPVVPPVVTNPPVVATPPPSVPSGSTPVVAGSSTANPSAPAGAGGGIAAAAPDSGAASVRNVSTVVGGLNFTPSLASRPAAEAAATALVSEPSGIAPTIVSDPNQPFEPFPLAASMPTNGPSPFVLMLLALGAISLGVFLGPRVRRFGGYWFAEARLALMSRKPPVS